MDHHELELMVDRHLQRLLEVCGDRTRTVRLPIIADAFDVMRGQQVSWQNLDGMTFVPSNFARQQNFLRNLVAFSRLSRNQIYARRAHEISDFMMCKACDRNGLFYWGSHAMIDLKTGRIVAPSEKELVHELKHVLPAYEILYTTDQNSCSRYVRAFWSSHVLDVARCDIGRHGKYNGVVKDAWCGLGVQRSDPHRPSSGLSFVTTGNDLIWAASCYFARTGDRIALLAGQRLLQEYSRARDAVTQLGGYQFTSPKQTKVTCEDENTSSRFGDRAQRQFEADFGPTIREGILAGFLSRGNRTFRVRAATDRLEGPPERARTIREKRTCRPGGLVRENADRPEH